MRKLPIPNSSVRTVRTVRTLSANATTRTRTAAIKARREPLLTPGQEIANADRGVVYSVVEMSADGGLGDVVRKNVRLIAPTTEKLVGVRHCNGRDYWAVVHTPGDDAYHAFLVSPSGVDPAGVVSHAGSVHTYHAGWLTASTTR